MPRFGDESSWSHELLVTQDQILEACRGDEEWRRAIQLNTATAGLVITGLGIAVRNGREKPYVEIRESNGEAHRGILTSAGVRLGSRLTLGNKSGKQRTDPVVGVLSNPYREFVPQVAVDEQLEDEIGFWVHTDDYRQ